MDKVKRKRKSFSAMPHRYLSDGDERFPVFHIMQFDDARIYEVFCPYCKATDGKLRCGLRYIQYRLDMTYETTVAVRCTACDSAFGVFYESKV